MADILVDNQADQAAPASGQSLIYVNSTSKRLVQVNDAGNVETVGGLTNASTADQTGFSSDTYLSGSNILIPPSKARVGMLYHCGFDMTKTGAGTAAGTVIVRVGTAGAIGDTARITFTFGAGTAAADTGWYDVYVACRTAGASGVLQGIVTMRHLLAATGLTNTGTGGDAIFTVTSSAFDLTVANLQIGISYNGGASFAGTNTQVRARLMNC